MKPEKAYLLIIVGILSLLGPSMTLSVDIEKPRVAIACGLFISLLNTFAGVSGVVLNLFFLKSTMDPKSIVGTKSLTQTMAHLVKILIYGRLLFTSGDFTLKTPLLITLMFTTFAGGWFGKVVVLRLPDQKFRQYSFALVRIFGLSFILMGLHQLFYKFI